MKKCAVFVALAAVLIGFVCITSDPVSAQATFRNAGERQVIWRANSTLTNSYTTNSAYADLENWGSAAMSFRVNSGTGAETLSIKTQWSHDRSSWVDESVLVAGTASGGEQVYTNLSRVIQMTTTNSAYIERFNRLSRFLRVTIKSSAASPSTFGSGLEVEVMPVSN